MSKKWNYAELSRDVAMAGGPEKFINTIKEYSYKKGIDEGRKQKNPVIAISILGGIGVGVGIEKIYQGIKQHIKGKKRKKIVMEREVSEAEQQFIKEMEHSIPKELENLDVKTELERVDNSENNHIVKLEEKENEEEK